MHGFAIKVESKQAGTCFSKSTYLSEESIFWN